jgi:hypothetical protein
MTQVNSEYGKRFGSGVEQIAENARRQAAAANQQSTAAGTTKYSKWFFGEENGDGQTRQKIATGPQFKPIDFGRMAAAEIAQATLNNLGILGDETFAKCAKSLGQKHGFKKELSTGLIAKNTMPWLGSCKMGVVENGMVGKLRSVQAMFMGNFDADIDPTRPMQDLYRVKGRDFGETFYGLHMLLDGNKFVGFDNSKGDQGLAFHTSDIREANLHIASAALGLSIEQLKEIARQNAARKAA